MNIEVVRYTEKFKNAWDEFIEHSKNGTFLFKRSFMDYHKDRFEDYSIIVLENDVIVALMPANIDENEPSITSHSGLTYGGFVVSPSASVGKVINYIHLIIKHLNQNGILSISIKHLPDFFATCSQAEIEYAYFLLNAKLTRLDTAYAFDYKNNYNRKLPKGRKSEIKKGERNKVKVKETESFKVFWNSILTPNLQKRFNVSPVHTFEEINSLKEKNPKNIKQFIAIYNDHVVAGATIFETQTTAHVQYLAGDETARKTGALDYLFSYLIDFYASSKLYFDFGITNENNGLLVNGGMAHWKESFGTRVFLHKFYEISTENYTNIDAKNYLI